VDVVGVGRAPDPQIPHVRYIQVATYEAIRTTSPAQCVHLAGSRKLSDDPAEVENEMRLATRVARHLVRQNFSRIIFSSSASVYGDQIATPRREDEMLAPQSGYAKLKMAVGEVFLSHGHTVARVANVYGPELPQGNALSDILKQIPGSGPIVVDDATPVRDYIHVTDVVRGLADLVLADVSGVFNVGTGVGSSIGHLAQSCVRLAGEGDRTVISRSQHGRSSTVILDPAKMLRVLGWRAAQPLAQGLQELVSWWLQHGTPVMAAR